jgi:hypothetical protein
MMEGKEGILIGLTEVLNDKKSKLSKKSRETLIIIREEIKKAKTARKYQLSLAKLAAFAGILWPNTC